MRKLLSVLPILATIALFGSCAVWATNLHSSAFDALKLRVETLEERVLMLEIQQTPTILNDLEEKRQGNFEHEVIPLMHRI